MTCDKQPFVSLGTKIPFSVNGQINMDSLPESGKAIMEGDLTAVQPMTGKSFFVYNILKEVRKHHAPLP